MDEKEMRVIDLINSQEKTAFSIEILPPLKGTGIERLYQTIDMLREFDPKYINITTHRSEYVYKELGNGLFQRNRLRRRPGTVAVAAAIQNKYGITVVPHILCSGYTCEDTEYTLLDLQFLGITDLLVLRGDKAKAARGKRARSGAEGVAATSGSKRPRRGRRPSTRAKGSEPADTAPAKAAATDEQQAVGAPVEDSKQEPPAERSRSGLRFLLRDIIGILERQDDGIHGLRICEERYAALPAGTIRSPLDRYLPAVIERCDG